MELATPADTGGTMAEFAAMRRDLHETIQRTKKAQAVVREGRIRTQRLSEDLSKKETRMLCQQILDAFPPEIRNMIYKHVIGYSKLPARSLLVAKGERFARFPCIPVQSNIMTRVSRKLFARIQHLWDMDTVGSQFYEEFLYALHNLAFSVSFYDVNDLDCLRQYLDEATASPSPKYIFTQIEIGLYRRAERGEPMISHWIEYLEPAVRVQRRLSITFTLSFDRYDISMEHTAVFEHEDEHAVLGDLRVLLLDLEHAGHHIELYCRCGCPSPRLENIYPSTSWNMWLGACRRKHSPKRHLI